MTDIDRLIATEVMGWVEYPAKTGSEWCEPDAKTKGLTGTVRHLVSEFSPSTRIDHAWEVVERFAKTFTVEIDGGSVWFCVIDDDDKINVTGKGETAPLAICKAALAAVESRTD